MFSVILLLILIVYAYNTGKSLKKLEDENKKLKKIIAKYESQRKENEVLKTNTSYNIENKTNEEKVMSIKTQENAKLYSSDIEEGKVKKQVSSKVSDSEPKKQIDKNDVKNTGILFTGAILIVLSAIVFLMSAWNVIPNVLKIVNIALFIAIFLGASKIAKDKFKLEKTSLTFFYIAMAYIPIGLVACSVFGLFGEYFSSYGEGKYIYFCLTGVVTSLIYYMYYKKMNNKVLLVGTILSQILSVILLGLIFTKAIITILIMISIYNIILVYFSKNQKELECLEVFYSNIPYVISAISIIYILFDNMYMLVLMPLIAVNLFITINAQNQKRNIYLLSIIVYLFGVYFAFIINNDNYFYSILGLVYWIIVSLLSNSFIENENVKQIFFNISHIFLLINAGYILEQNQSINNIILSLILEIVYIYSFIKNQDKRYFKYLAYSALGLLLFTIVNTFESKVVIYLIPIMIEILIQILENTISKLKDRYSDIFNCILQIISFIFIVRIKYEIGCLISLLYSAYLIIDNLSNNKNQYLRIIPMGGVFTILEINKSSLINDYTSIIMLSIAVILTMISIYKKQISVDTVFSGIYLIAFINYIDNDIIKYIFILIWALSNIYFMKKQRDIDIFKVITYSSLFLIYNDIVTNYFSKISSLTMIGITILAILISKTVVKRYSQNTDAIEYLVFAIINWIALLVYTNEADGMIYVAFLILLLIYSYNSKYGAIFIVTACSIIINAILLTRQFWLLIPWWIYLLVIGSLLIGFAIRNESKSIKSDPKNIIKNIKDKIEK